MRAAAETKSLSDFRPLISPKVPSRKPERAEPLAWFEVLATHFPDAAIAPAIQSPARAEGGGAQKALFGSIDTIARDEDRRRRAGEPEPEDVIKLRVDAAEEARRLVADAREQARILLEESREQGHRQGYEAGYAAGDQDARRSLTQRADDERVAYQADLNLFLSGVEATSRQAWLEMEPQVIELVFEIARKVIKMEVDLNRAAAIEVVKNTLRRVADSTSLRIRVHADDLETVRGNREDLYALVDSIRKIEIVEDRRVGPGGCIVETDAGTIDARIETQLEEVRKMLAAGSW